MTFSIGGTIVIFITLRNGCFFLCFPDKTDTFTNEKWRGGTEWKERMTVLLAANIVY